MSVSIREVAQRAGVSVGTVSNVLNRPDLVAPATRQRVVDVIQQIGFVRNESARHLRAGRSRTVGLVVLDVGNPFFTDVARGVESVADANATMVVLCNTGEDPQREQRHLEMLEQQRVLGILITPVASSHPQIEEIASRGTPVVLVDRRSTRRNRCSVGVDDEFGGRLAVGHLLDQGHRRIGFVGGPFTICQVVERHDGAQQAIDAADVNGSLTVFKTASLTVSQGGRAASEIAAVSPARRPTAVFCANDLLALGVLQELTRRGIKVPDDVALIGYDDIDFAAAAVVPLSSIRQPREQLGRTAAELMFAEAEDGVRHKHRQVVFEPELVIRESSARRRGRPTRAGAATAAGSRRAPAAG